MKKEIMRLSRGFPIGPYENQWAVSTKQWKSMATVRKAETTVFQKLWSSMKGRSVSVKTEDDVCQIQTLLSSLAKYRDMLPRSDTRALEGNSV